MGYGNNVTRKKVYFERQGIVECWEHSETLGYKKIDRNDAMDWSNDSFDFYTIVCSDESFEKSNYGLLFY